MAEPGTEAGMEHVISSCQEFINGHSEKNIPAKLAEGNGYTKQFRLLYARIDITSGRCRLVSVVEALG